MKPKIVWDEVHSLGMVMNPDASGMPYVGVLRRQDLLDGWTATSSMYAGPEELGVYADEDEALAAVLEEAARLQERRTRSAEIAALKKVECERIRGAGRTSVYPPETERYHEFIDRSRSRGRGRAKGREVIAAADEATP